MTTPYLFSRQSDLVPVIMVVRGHLRPSSEVREWPHGFHWVRLWLDFYKTSLKVIYEVLEWTYKVEKSTWVENLTITQHIIFVSITNWKRLVPKKLEN